jgi:hypothetical protein
MTKNELEDKVERMFAELPDLAVGMIEAMFLNDEGNIDLDAIVTAEAVTEVRALLRSYLADEDVEEITVLPYCPEGVNGPERCRLKVNASFSDRLMTLRRTLGDHPDMLCVELFDNTMEALDDDGELMQTHCQTMKVFSTNVEFCFYMSKHDESCRECTARFEV